VLGNTKNLNRKIFGKAKRYGRRTIKTTQGIKEYCRSSARNWKKKGPADLDAPERKKENNARGVKEKRGV